MEQPPSSPSLRRRSDGSVRESLFFPVLERNEQERLEALMRRSVERGLQLEQRPKRWTWGGPAGACEGDTKAALPSHPPPATLANDPAAFSPASQSRNVPDFMNPSEFEDSTLSKRLSSSSAALPNMTERASPSPHRSPYRGSPGRAERSKVTAAFTGPLQETVDEPTAPKPPQPQAEKQAVEKVTTPTLAESPHKRLESPTTPTRSSSSRNHNKNLGTPKRVRSTKSRVQSPCSPGQYPPSPLRQRATTPGADSNKRWAGEERGAVEGKGYSTLERKSSKAESAERKIPKSASRDMGDRSSEPSAVTPTGKTGAGTTDAEEACRLLAERRRLARVQKEQDERERMEKERLRAEVWERKQEEEREQRERAAQQAEEDKHQREEESRRKEEEDRRQKERRWKELEDQIDREREEAFQRAQREVERKREERELLQLQEEQERLQRKKRIDEIMKRTRKPETDTKKEELQVVCPSHISLREPVTPSHLEAKDSAQMNGLRTGVVEVLADGVRAEESLMPSTNYPLKILEPLEPKNGGADDLSDGVQSMDVSPVSRDELISIPGSPGSELSQMNGSRTLDDLIELTGQASYPKVPSLGDCNKNLIQGFSDAAAESQLIQSLGPVSDKLSIQ